MMPHGGQIQYGSSESAWREGAEQVGGRDGVWELDLMGTARVFWIFS